MFVFGQDSIQGLFFQDFAHLFASSSDRDLLISGVKKHLPEILSALQCCTKINELPFKAIFC